MSPENSSHGFSDKIKYIDALNFEKQLVPLFWTSKFEKHAIPGKIFRNYDLFQQKPTAIKT